MPTPDQREDLYNSGNWPKDEDQSTKEGVMTNHGLMRKDDCSAPRLIGVSRVEDEPYSYMISFDRPLNNAELADIHDTIHDHMKARAEAVGNFEQSLRRVFDPTKPVRTKDHLF